MIKKFQNIPLHDLLLGGVALSVFLSYLLFSSYVNINGIYFLVYLAFFYFILSNKNVLQVYKMELGQSFIFLVLFIGFELRHFYSLNSFSHINYHGAGYVNSILSFDFRENRIPYGFTYQVLLFPFFPLIKYLGVAPLFVMNLLLNLFTGLSLFIFIKRLLSNVTLGYLALWIFCFAPTQIRYAMSESQFNLLSAMIALFLALVVIRKERRDTSIDAMIYLLLALMIFLRPEMLVGWIPLHLFFYYYNRDDLLNNQRHAVFIFLIFLAIISFPFYNSFSKIMILAKESVITPLRYYHQGVLQNRPTFPPFFLQYSPIYLLSLVGISFALFIQSYRLIALGSLAIFFGMVLLFPHTNVRYEVGAHYLHYLEFFPIIGLVFLGYASQKYIKSEQLKRGALLSLFLLPFIQFIFKSEMVKKKYDEQIEFSFLKEHYQESMGKIRLLGPETDRNLVYYYQAQLFFHLEERQLELMFPEMNKELFKEIYFRPLALGELKYDEKLKELGFVPLETTEFSFDERFESYNQGMKFKIGFYRRESRDSKN